MIMVHYYEKTNEVDDDKKTYCGLFVADVSRDLNNTVDHIVLETDITKETICPECAKHPSIQMQILKVTEL